MDAVETFLSHKVELNFLGLHQAYEALKNSFRSAKTIERLLVDASDAKLVGPRISIYFFDSSVEADLYKLVKSFVENDTPVRLKLAYDIASVSPSRAVQLLCSELGVDRLFFGPERDRQLVEFVRLMSHELQKVGSVFYYRYLLAECQRENKREDMIPLIKRFAQLEIPEAEKCLLHYTAQEYMGRFKAASYYLKRRLALFPQQLYYASKLSATLLKRKQVAEALEILQRLQQFHDLNYDRVYNLGSIYIDLRNPKRALVEFKRGLKMCNGKDPRFTIGIAKVCVMIGEFQKADTFLGAEYPRDMIAFLVRYAVYLGLNKDYIKALEIMARAETHGTKTPPLMLAYLRFNKGLLAYKASLWEEASASFASCAAASLPNFSLAKELEVLTGALKQQAAGEPASDALKKQVQKIPFVKF